MFAGAAGFCLVHRCMTGFMVLWIGVDDTDSLGGMCTTFLATELVRDLTEDFDLIGYPRLVRLNPNIPWKTRGNGALCIRIGRGRGRPYTIGEIRGRSIVSHQYGSDPSDVQSIEERVAKIVERWSRFEDPNTNPGFVVLRKQARAGLYWKAVRGIVSKREARAAAAGRGSVRGYKNGRGLIGAIAATAWRPRDRTYEILTYRSPERWGTRRNIIPESVIRMDRLTPSAFNNYDYENQRVVIAPRSPCPVLFGIRGDDPSVLHDAMDMVQGEAPERFLVFETNQGTDDHVSPQKRIRPRTTLLLSSVVRSDPREIPGGHVVVRLKQIDVAAYEPSKQFRSIVRCLRLGDRVQVIGAIRDRPRTLNLEKLFVEATVPVTRKLANPWCADCRKHAKSLGRGAGYRCIRCGVRFSQSATTSVSIERNLAIGWYEPPVGSRRHLSKPLKRMERRVASDLSNPAPARFRVPESGTVLRHIGPPSQS